MYDYNRNYKEKERFRERNRQDDIKEGWYVMYKYVSQLNNLIKKDYSNEYFISIVHQLNYQIESELKSKNLPIQNKYMDIWIQYVNSFNNAFKNKKDYLINGYVRDLEYSIKKNLIK